MFSRELKDLSVTARIKTERFLVLCGNAGLDVLIYCTYRDFEEQAKLYRCGRTLEQIKHKAKELEDKYGRPDLAKVLLDTPVQYDNRVLTWAGPGQSEHNYREAFDGVPMLNGKPVWRIVGLDAAHLWSLYGRLAYDAGLEWAGTWKRFIEYPHCQNPLANWKESIKKGQT